MENYIELAQVTNTNDFHPEIGRRIVAQCLEPIIDEGEYLDAIKKNQFYGRNTDESKTVLDSQAFAAIHYSEEFMEPVDFSAMFPTLDRESAIKVYHGILGTITEAVELAQALRESLRENTPMDLVNVVEEIGDQQWYHASIASALKITFGHIQRININKLTKRFGGKFDAYKAQQENRPLVEERKILEDGYETMDPACKTGEQASREANFEQINKVAGRGLNIILSGPSGCGKGLAGDALRGLIPNAKVSEHTTTTIDVTGTEVTLY